MSTIDVTNSGPLEGTFTVDLSPGPGVYEFRGARGTGKTTVLSSIDWLTGHKVDVTLHDSAISGKIEGFGVVAPIGGRKRRKGEFALDTIDAEKFSLSDILDPQGKTPEVRDATRIKALAVLSETQADPELYYELVGGQPAFDALGISPTEDPVLLATRVKTAFDKRATQHGNSALAEAKHAAPLEHVPDDLDMSQSSDLFTLGNVRDEARDAFQQLKSSRESGLAKEQEVAQSQSRLQTIRSEYKGPSVNDAESALQVTLENGHAAKTRVEDLERALDRARGAVESWRREYAAALATREAARSHATAVEELSAIASQTVTCPDFAAVATAGESVEAASLAYDQGIRIHDVKRNQENATAYRKAEKAAQEAADEARNQAGQVFDILAQSLQAKHLEIKSVDGNPRLFVQHPKRGRCAFDSVNGLSDGERVDYTLRELLPHIDSPGLLPIPQRVWQDLQPADRKRLHKLAVEKKLYLFGAQVDDGELRVVFLGDQEEEGD